MSVKKCKLCESPVYGWGVCRRHYDQERRRNPEFIEREKNLKKEYFKKNKERISKEYAEWYNGPGREHERQRGLKRRYGIDSTTYTELLNVQNGKCAICQTPDPGSRNKYFHVDHCHSTGTIRGLLCFSCNVMLGFAKNSPSFLREGATYLEKYPLPKIKQVIVMRRKFTKNGQPLGLRTGKQIAQAAHAATAFLVEKVKTGERLTEIERKWFSDGQTKICLQVDSEDDLMVINQRAIEAGLICRVITDMGLTEFDGVPTKTCLAIGPDDSDKIDAITGDLELY